MPSLKAEDRGEVIYSRTQPQIRIESGRDGDGDGPLSCLSFLTTSTAHALKHYRHTSTDKNTQLQRKTVLYTTYVQVFDTACFSLPSLHISYPLSLQVQPLWEDRQWECTKVTVTHHDYCSPQAPMDESYRQKSIYSPPHHHLQLLLPHFFYVSIMYRSPVSFSITHYIIRLVLPRGQGRAWAASTSPSLTLLEAKACDQRDT